MSTRLCVAALAVLLTAAGGGLVLGATPRCYAKRFQVKTAGEVTDAATGLTWQQAVGAGTWNEAKAFCSGAWRVPSFGELLSIVDMTKPNGPMIDQDAFPGTPNEGFWTSTVNSTFTDRAWLVFFANGLTDYQFLTSSYRVRCVR